MILFRFERSYRTVTNAIRRPKCQGTNQKKNLEKKVFLWQFSRKNEKIENYPVTLPEKSNYFQHVKIIDIRYPATTGYPDPAIHLPDYPVSGRISISGPTLINIKALEVQPLLLS